MNSFLMLQGLETLTVRMSKHCENALLLAQYLQNHPMVSWVNYPGLSHSRYHGRVKKLFNELGGGVLTFGLGTKDRAFQFLDSLKLARNLANLGDAKTLVLHPASTIFHEFADSENEKMGVKADMVRVSVGIEDFVDIKTDFEQAIEKSC
jgi:O-acetylhomoserine (thiol)-lyase